MALFTQTYSTWIFTFFFQSYKNVKTAAETPTKGLESIFVNWLNQEMYIMVYWQKVKYSSDFLLFLPEV